MYSIVLMAAMTAGPASSGFGHGFGAWYGSYGSAHSCYGCGGCRGCYGCGGCNGYFGGATGYNYGIAHGYQSSFSVYAPVACAGHHGCGGCYGCYGGWSCYGVALPHHGYWNECAPAVAPSFAPPMEPAVSPEKAKDRLKIEETPLPKEEKKEEPKKDVQTRARLTIDAPADARVFLDGELLNVSAANRVFKTPVLVTGETYYYDIRVEVERNGRTVAESKRVVMRAGELATAAFPRLHGSTTATALGDR